MKRFKSYKLALFHHEMSHHYFSIYFHYLFISLQSKKWNIISEHKLMIWGEEHNLMVWETGVIPWTEVLDYGLRHGTKTHWQTQGLRCGALAWDAGLWSVQTYGLRCESQAFVLRYWAAWAQAPDTWQWYWAGQRQACLCGP